MITIEQPQAIGPTTISSNAFSDYREQLNKNISTIRDSLFYLEDEKTITKYTTAFELSAPIKIGPEQDFDIEFFKKGLYPRAFSFAKATVNVLEFQAVDAEHVKKAMQAIFALLQHFNQQVGLLQNLDNLDAQKKIWDALKKLKQEIALILNDICEIDYTEALENLTAAEILNNWQKHPTIVTQIAQQHELIHQPVTYLTEAQIEEYQQIDSENPPLWFQALSSYEQWWIQNHKDEIISGKLGPPPSSFRKVPGLANANWEFSIVKDEEGHIISVQKTLTHSAIPPIKVENDKERQRLATMNALQLEAILQQNRKKQENYFNSKIENELPIRIKFTQTLLSPVPIFDWIFHYTDNNHWIREETETALENTKIITTNWPINSTRIFSPSFSNKNNEATKNQLISDVLVIINPVLQEIDLTKILEDTAAGENVISTIQKFLQHLKSAEPAELDPLEIRQLAMLLHDTIETWHLKIFDYDENDTETKIKAKRKAHNFCMTLHALADYIQLWNNYHQCPAGTNPELFAAALENLILNGLGCSVSVSCKSGKDRTRFYAAYVTSMQIYYARYGLLPTPFDDAEEREQFTAIVTEVLGSNHHQKVNSYNSAGCLGIQNGKGPIGKIPFVPSMVPKDIAYKFGSEKLDTQHKLAKSINIKITPPGFWKRLWQKIKPVLVKLKPKSFFNKQTNVTSGSPTDFGPDSLSLEQLEVSENSLEPMPQPEVICVQTVVVEKSLKNINMTKGNESKHQEETFREEIEPQLNLQRGGKYVYH